MIPRYPGAHPFGDDSLSRVLFKGRDVEANALTNMILTNRLVVLFARSGLGKSSLLNAGVMERLRSEGFAPLMIRLNNPQLGVMETVYRGVQAEAQRQAIEHERTNIASLWSFFKTAEFWIDNQLCEPILILDQFEEIFTIHSEYERELFLDHLSHLVRGVPPAENLPSGISHITVENTGHENLDETPPRVRVVLSLREDFLGWLEELSSRIPGVLDNRLRLLPLSRESAELALNEPSGIEDIRLATQPFQIEESARTAVLDFLEQDVRPPTYRASNDIEPFQLQLICQHIEELALKKESAVNGTPTTIGLSDIGGEARLRRILRKFCIRQIKAAPFFQRNGVKKLCSENLISVNGRRLRMEESEINAILGVKPSTLRVLVDRRLLRTDKVIDETYYELSHDSLVDSILMLSRWRLLRKTFGKIIVVALIIFYLIATFWGSLESVAEQFNHDLTAWEDEGPRLLGMLLGVAVVFWLGWRVGLPRAREARALWRRLRFGMRRKQLSP